MSHIYIFSGLGADERMFQLLHFAGHAVTFIRWIQPYQQERIEHYAKRLTEQIGHSQPILIGLSFGGMMAVEVAKLIATEKLLLIASAKTRQEIPFYYRLAGHLHLHKLLPAKLLKCPTFFSYWLFGTQCENERVLLANILRDTDPVFLLWAIGKIVNWQNQTLLSNLQHIHGTSDRILPIRFVGCDTKIIGGGHFMTINKPVEINNWLNKML